MTTRTIGKKSPKLHSTAGGFKLRVVATNKSLGKLCRDSLKRVRSCDRSHIDLLTFHAWQDVDIHQPSVDEYFETVFISRLKDIPEKFPLNAQIGAIGKHLLFAQDFPVEAIVSRLINLGIRSQKRVHIAAETDSSAISDLVYRVLAGIAEKDGRCRIVDAWVEDGNLVVLEPAFSRMSVPIEKLQRFVGNDESKVAEFEIDEDGSFLYWPHADIHLGWTQLKHLIDPYAALLAQKKTKEFNLHYGEAIRSLRVENKLRQADIVGITERNLRRVEKGELMASESVLQHLSDAHGLRLEEYMDSLAQRVGN